MGDLASLSGADPLLFALEELYKTVMERRKVALQDCKNEIFALGKDGSFRKISS